jgi:hypothetical protein
MLEKWKKDPSARLRVRYTFRIVALVTYIPSIVATISQFGDLGTAMWSLVIAFHTFWSVSPLVRRGCVGAHIRTTLRLLFLQRKPAEWASNTTLFVISAFVFMMPIIGTYAVPGVKHKGNFWGPTGKLSLTTFLLDFSHHDKGAWCWVHENYELMRLFWVYVSKLLCVVT